MIISHKNRFIFLKTEKTAGTSIEIALSKFVQSREANTVLGFDIYTQWSEIVVDEAFKYEQLQKAMEDIRDQLSLPEAPSLPHAKANFRPDRRSYHHLLSHSDREKIAKVYAREIAYFGYEY